MGYSTYFITQHCIELPHSEELEDFSEDLWGGKEDYKGFDKNFKIDLDFNWMRVGPVLFQSQDYRWGDGDGDWDKEIDLASLEDIRRTFITNFAFYFDGKYPDITNKLLEVKNWKLVSYIHTT